MSKYATNSLQISLDKLNQHRSSAPYVVELTEENNFVNSVFNEINYNEVGEADKHQALKDWLRGRKNIFINGVAFADIIINVQQEMLIHYLQALTTGKAGWSQAEIESSWGEIYQLLTDNLQDPEKSYVNSVLADFQNPLADPEQTKEQAAFMVKNLTGEKIAKIDESDLPEALKESLKDKLLEIYNYMRITEERANVSRLESLWRNTLLAEVKDKTTADAYIKKLFGIAHQGGVIYSLNTAHGSELAKKLSDEPYAIDNVATAKNTITQFYLNGKNIEIVENSPVPRLVEMMNPEAPGIVKSAGDFIFEGVIKHTITMQDDETAAHNLRQAQDIFYSDAAFKAIYPDLFRLVNYANNYLKDGHNAAEVKALLEQFPEIQNVATSKQSYSSFFPGRSSAHQEGDKILSYLYKVYPGYVTTMQARAAEYHQDKSTFIKFMKLLTRVNSQAAIDMLKDYYHAIGEDKPSSKRVLGEKEFGKAYDELKAKHAFEIWKPKAVIIHEAHKEDTQTLKAHKILTELLTVGESQATPHVNARKISEFFKEEKAIPAKTLQVYQDLLIHAQTNLQKHIVIYAMTVNPMAKALANKLAKEMNVSELKQDVLAELASRTLTSQEKGLEDITHAITRFVNTAKKETMAVESQVLLDKIVKLAKPQVFSPRRLD